MVRCESSQVMEIFFWGERKELSPVLWSTIASSVPHVLSNIPHAHVHFHCKNNGKPVKEAFNT
jgi:hypothetical protein